MSSAVWAFRASRSTLVMGVTRLLLDLSGPVYNNVPASIRSPSYSWEGSADARDCRDCRADPAVGVHPIAAARLGDGWVGVDCPISESCVQHDSPGKLVLGSCWHLRSPRAARSRIYRRYLGHDGGSLHDSLPPGPLRDPDAVGGVGVVGCAADGVVLLGRSREVSHRAGRLGLGPAQAQPADSVGHTEGRGHIAARSEEHTSELQSLAYLVCRLLLEKKKKTASGRVE